MYDPASKATFTDKLWAVFDNSRGELHIPDFEEEEGCHSNITWCLYMTVEFQKVEGTKKERQHAAKREPSIEFLQTPGGDLYISFRKVSRPSLEEFFSFPDNIPDGYTPRLTEINPALAS